MTIGVSKSIYNFFERLLMKEEKDQQKYVFFQTVMA